MYRDRAEMCDRQLQLETAAAAEASIATTAMRMGSQSVCSSLFSASSLHIGRILIERKENFCSIIFRRWQYNSPANRHRWLLLGTHLIFVHIYSQLEWHALTLYLWYIVSDTGRMHCGSYLQSCIVVHVMQIVNSSLFIS